MKKIFLFFAVLLIVPISCKKDTVNIHSESCYSNTNVRTINYDGINREYLIYIPDSYDGNSSVPVIFNFHGFGDNVTDFSNNNDMRTVAESNNSILLYPQGSCLEGASHWNPCPTGEDNKSTADDIGFVEFIINEMASQYNIDMERIYAVGYSNGGMMAYGLAHYKSNLFAAVASVSGAMLDCTGPVSHPMPILHLHGTADEVIPYNGDSYYSSVQNTLNHWIEFNNTTSNPTVTIENSEAITIEHFTYDQGDNSVSVEHYKYNGGGHVWFKEAYQGQNTSELLWNFFSRYDINGVR